MALRNKFYKMKNDKIIYALTIEDVQTVANEALGRDLTLSEIEKIKESIAEKISWYDAIDEAINENINKNSIMNK
jgi:hypothetical protein